MLRKLCNKQRHANWQQRINISFLLPIFILLLSVTFGMGFSGKASAAPVDTLNFQGRLATNTGGSVSDGSYNIAFTIYDDPTAGTSQWTETQSVTVRNGYFSVYLGDVTPFTSSIPWDQELWMTMNVDSDGEMTPRIKLSAVPYAFRAGAVTDSSGNAFTGDDLIQKAPAAVQEVNAALAAIRLNQIGSGSLIQLQADGSDVFTVARNGGTSIAAGLTLGSSTSTTAGTIRWSGTDFEGFDGLQWVSLTEGSGGGGGGSSVATTAVKSATQTINNNGALFNDADLNFAIGANETWAFRFVIFGNSATQPDFQFAVSAPTGATCQVGVSDPEGATSISNLGCGVSSGVVAGNGADDVYEVIGTVVNGSTAGTVNLQWAQNSSNAGNTTVYAGSYVVATAEGVAGGGGASEDSFVDGGNAFAGTAILGTTDNNGLVIITNNTAALTFAATGEATFASGVNIDSGGLSITGGLDNNSGGITEAGSVSGLSSLSGSGALTISSGSASDLTLDSASDVLALADATLRRSASGTTTLDLFDGSGATTFSVINSDGTQVAGLNVEGAITAASISGDGSGLTALDGSAISTGTIGDARLSANIVLLDQNQTFTGVPTFSAGLVLGTSSSTTAGAIRWSGTDFEGYDGIQWVSLTEGSGGGGGSTLLQGVMAIGKVAANGSNINIDGATATRNSIGFYSVDLDTAAANANYVVQLTVDENSTDLDDINISLTNQTVNGFDVYIREGDNGTGADDLRDKIWHFIAFDPAAEVGGGGGGGLSFQQDGNTFGETAILGTQDAFGLNFITGNSTALSLATDATATFTGTALLNGGVSIGNESSDAFTIVSNSVALTNGLNFDSNTFVIDAANNRVGIGTNLANNLLTINDATTADGLAQVILATGATTAKGLVIQAEASQSANLFEVQNSAGVVLGGFNASGGLVLGLSTLTSTATSSRSISLPDASGTICLSSSAACGYIQFAAGAYQTDASTADTIAINKTNATGSLLALQRSGGAVFTVANTGALQIQASSSTALDIRNASGTSYFTVDTNTGTVSVGPSTADAVGVLFVLDTKNTAGDPTGTNGGIYYNSSTGKFRCYENGIWKDCITSRTSIRSFIDSTADPLIDANTTNYWDTSAENNNSFPNITPSLSSGVSVYGTVTFELTSNTNQDVEATARVERGIGSVPTCGSGVSVGGLPGIFATNTGAVKSSTITFVDTANTTSQVFYVLCSDAATAGNLSADITRIRITLQEVSNTN